MTAPYRDEANAKRPPPARLACWLRDGDKNRWVRTMYVKLWLTVVIAPFLWTAGKQLAALIVLALGVLWALRDFVGRRGAEVVFTVDGEVLRVARAPGDELALSLEELLDVRLDTKATSRNVTMARADGVNTIFGMASNHNIELDVSRIELVTEDQNLLLAREFINGSLCMESLREIRLFLRAHGWKPADERA